MMIFLEKIVKEFQRDHSIDISLSVLSEVDEYNWNSDKVKSSASLIKLFILGSVVSDILAKKYNLNSEIEIKLNDFVQGSGLIKYTKSEFDLNIEDLIQLMVSFSDNIATNILLRLTSIESVNSFVRHINLLSTNVFFPMMKSKKTSKNKTNLTSANDVSSFYYSIFESDCRIEENLKVEIQRILLNSYNGYNANKRYLNSRLHKKLKRQIETHNNVGLSYYKKHSTDINQHRRLSKLIEIRNVLYSKPGTSKTIFSDSIIFQSKKNNVYVTVILSSDKADFTDSKNKYFIIAESFLSKIGKSICNKLITK
jgi:beta-lactamase class A